MKIKKQFSNILAKSSDKMKTGKILILLIAMALVSISGAYATYYEENFTAKPSYRSSMSNSDIDIQSLRYEPYPVNPGEYFTLWIKAENMGNKITKDAVFELIPEFPFSLDTNENPIRKYGELDARPVVLEYKIRVDKNAVEGSNEIKLRYDPGGSDSSGSIERTFDIQVQNVQTDFDLVVQEVSGSQVSIAIANTGKNPAYSTIVKIPDQDSFEASGTSGQMVGNLDDGDYTLVGFNLASKNNFNLGNRTRTNSQQTTNNPPQFSGRSQLNITKISLKVQIDYTDTIGERRTVIKEIPAGADLLALAGGNSTTRFSNGNGSRQFTQTTTKSIYQQWWFWLIIIVVLAALWKGYKFFKQRKEEQEAKKSSKR